MVEKELGERNFGFDALKSRLNCNMEETGIVARDCLPSTGSLPTATIPVSSMLRFNLNFRLIWMWKNQRRQKTRRMANPTHGMLLYGCFHIGVGGPLLQYLKTHSRNSVMVQNYSHYEPVRQWAFHKRIIWRHTQLYVLAVLPIHKALSQFSPLP